MTLKAGAIAAVGAAATGGTAFVLQQRHQHLASEASRLDAASRHEVAMYEQAVAGTAPEGYDWLTMAKLSNTAESDQRMADKLEHLPLAVSVLGLGVGGVAAVRFHHPLAYGAAAGSALYMGVAAATSLTT